MGYQVYWNDTNKRWQGYGVPAICEHPDCNEEVDRGLGCMCGNGPDDERGCGRFFCGKHLYVSEDDVQVCEQCLEGKEPFQMKPDTREWTEWILADESWEEWREENPEEVIKLKEKLKENDVS